MIVVVVRACVCECVCWSRDGESAALRRPAA